MTQKTEFTFTDRYQAAGIPYPNPATVCKGQCEGMGCYPQRGDDATSTPAEKAAWAKCHAEGHTLWRRIVKVWEYDFYRLDRRIALLWEKCDGYHFIKCPDCNGTGKVAP